MKKLRRIPTHGIAVVFLSMALGSLAYGADTVRIITLTNLAKSLPREPITVVFDVDDTALFTSAGFQWGTQTYGPDIVSAGVPLREEDLPSAEARPKYREFWTKMNNELDQYSIKKWIAGELIALHKARGDRISGPPFSSPMPLQSSSRTASRRRPPSRRSGPCSAMEIRTATFGNPFKPAPAPSGFYERVLRSITIQLTMEHSAKKYWQTRNSISMLSRRLRHLVSQYPCAMLPHRFMKWPP